MEQNYFKFSDAELSKMQDFGYFVGYVANLDVNHLDNHLRPQTDLIDLNNIDYIGRFENFEVELGEVLCLLGLGEIVISKESASKNRDDYREYYDKGLEQKTAMIYRKDLSIFSYEF